MRHSNLESAVLFVPGRASYMRPDDPDHLYLSRASERRAEVASNEFMPYVRQHDPDAEWENHPMVDFYTHAVFAGGYPGKAQQWEIEPPKNQREAILMARTLTGNLIGAHWTQPPISRYVRVQSESDNSIGDVAHSIQKGYLNPDDFNRSDSRHGIRVVAGFLHGQRFKDILSTGLQMDPKRIELVPMRDIYGMDQQEKPPGKHRETAPEAIAKELAVIALTKMVLHNLRHTGGTDLFEAEAHFMAKVPQ